MRKTTTQSAIDREAAYRGSHLGLTSC